MKVWVSNISDDFPNEPDSPEKTVEFKVAGKEFTAFYLGQEYVKGEEREVTLSFLDAYPDNTYESAFEGNPAHILGLEPDSFWSYHGYGKILSTSPTTCDFGVFQLEIGLEAKEVDLGKYVYWYIDRLGIDFE